MFEAEHVFNSLSIVKPVLTLVILIKWVTFATGSVWIILLAWFLFLRGCWCTSRANEQLEATKLHFGKKKMKKIKTAPCLLADKDVSGRKKRKKKPRLVMEWLPSCLLFPLLCDACDLLNQGLWNHVLYVKPIWRYNTFPFSEFICVYIGIRMVHKFKTVEIVTVCLLNHYTHVVLLAWLQRNWARRWKVCSSGNTSSAGWQKQRRKSCSDHVVGWVSKSRVMASFPTGALTDLVLKRISVIGSLPSLPHYLLHGDRPGIG